INIGCDQVEVGFQIEEPAQDGGILNLYHCTTHHNKGVGEGCQASFFVSINLDFSVMRWNDNVR
ncbi:MAG: hypothetical protein ACR5LB_04510, partial [Wolbachia sp.]